MSETFSFACPFCDRPMRVPTSAVGKSGKCKQCRNTVIVPKPKAEPSERPDKFIPAKRPFPWSVVYSTLAIICLFAWMVFANEDSTPGDYLFLTAACVFFWLTMVRISGRTVAHGVSAGVMIGTIGLYGWNDTVKSRWRDDDLRADYVDTYSRWGRTPLHRFAEVYDEAGKLDFQLMGPQTESGSAHGRWTVRHFQPEYKETIEHYHYGELVSEAEFHRLQNQ